MDERSKRYADILKEKADALTDILNATKNLKITGIGDDDHLALEAELFSSLYEQREDIIAEIKKMDEDMAQYSDLPEDKKTTGKIAKIAKEIASLDKKNMEAGEKLASFLKGNLKTIRDGRGISTAYEEHHGSTSGYHFDTTN